MATLPSGARFRRIPLPAPRPALALAAGALYAFVLTIAIVTILALPRVSLVLSRSSPREVRIAWLLPTGSLWMRGARQGDLVLALDGRPAAAWPHDNWTGAQVLFQTRAGQRVLVRADSAEHGRAAWPLLLLSPWFLLLGTLVVLRAADAAVGRAAYALFATAAFALALGPPADCEQVLAVMAELAALPLFAAAFARFFLIFPAPYGGANLRRALLVPALVMLAVGVVSVPWPAWCDAAGVLDSTILFGYLLLGAGLLIAAAVTSRTSTARRGLAIIGTSTAAGVLPFLALYQAPTLLGRPPLLPAEQAILALALLPAGFAYAILRYQTLPVPLLQRWAVRGLTWALLLLCYLTVAYAAQWLTGGVPTPARGLVFTAALALLVGLAGRRLYDRLQRALNRLIFKDSYDYRATLQEISHQISLAADHDRLSKALPSRLRDLMNLSFAVLLERDAHGIGVCVADGDYPPTLVDALATRVQEAPEESLPVALSDEPDEPLIVPLRTHGAPVGYLCLGAKRSGEPYGAADRALLATLSGHLASALRNMRLVDVLRARVEAMDALSARLERSQEEERARLAAELHDEPLQTAMQLQRLVGANDQDGVATAQCLALGEALIAQLRAICRSVRPPLLAELGLSAALELLARDLSAHAGVRIQVVADRELRDLVLPAGADLVLYRAAQEALGNALRHAHPSLITVVLRRQPGAVSLLVKDDGAGFVVPASLEALATMGHFGLAGLQRRVRGAGGRLAITAVPGAGTVVEVRLPVTDARSHAMDTWWDDEEAATA